MHGKLQLIPANQSEPTLLDLNRPVSLDEIEKAVGGPLGQVPEFDTILQDGEVRLCYVFCDEEARTKFLPPNQLASTLWEQSQVRIYGFGKTKRGTSLFGSIAILTGDPAFFDALGA